jgi:hypothetical protein
VGCLLRDHDDHTEQGRDTMHDKNCLDSKLNTIGRLAIQIVTAFGCLMIASTPVEAKNISSSVSIINLNQILRCLDRNFKGVDASKYSITVSSFSGRIDLHLIYKGPGIGGDLNASMKPGSRKCSIYGTQ